MAVNHKSGRIVVDIDPGLKMALHSALAADGLSLKQWFSNAAQHFIHGHRQSSLAFSSTLPSGADLINNSNTINDA